MTAQEYITKSESYNKRLELTSLILNKITEGHKNELGLIDEATRKSKEYINAKYDYDLAFEMLRGFNNTIPNKTKREAQKIRRN
jgi:hypothetical protein